MLELFCGTAGVTASFKRCGFKNCLAVDKIRPARPLASILQLDLADTNHQEIVMSWLRHPDTCAVFLGPPCGAASAARSIQLQGESNLPQPLRSMEAPDGLMFLENADFIRVELANRLYHFTAEVCRECMRLNIPWVVENPLRSLFWETTPWPDLHSSFEGSIFFQEHQACAYGSRRPKWTFLAANFSQIKHVNKLCDQSHEHEPWGVQRSESQSGRVFATALEVHYPKLLCDAISHAFVLQFSARGFKVTTSPTMQEAAAAFTFKQTGKSPQVLQPFKSKMLTLCSPDGVMWPTSFSMDKSLKLLHRSEVGVAETKKFGDIEDEIKLELKAWNMDEQIICNVPKCFAVREFSIFGVQWSPDEFLDRCMQTVHPCDSVQALPEVLLDTVCKVPKMSDVELAKHRLLFMRHWNRRALELQSSEEELKSQMDPGMARALQSKRILLFEEMVQSLGFPDGEVVSELKDGASLVGTVPLTNMLPSKFVPALLSESMLSLQAPLVRSRFEGPSKGSGDPELDDSVWQQTLAEVDSNWLEGPLGLDQVPISSPLSRRFGVRQGPNKVRCVDDFSASNVNDAVETWEAPALHTVDVCAAMAKALMAELEASGKETKLVARTFDLSSANRQVALKPDHRRFGHLAVHDPSSLRWRFFRATVLPFGATRSVHSFLRLSRAIWWLGSKGLLLCWTSFYDDFVVFSTPSMAKSTELAVAAFLRLLGWLFAESGKKCMPFDETCSALGVTFDLSYSTSLQCRICNTDKRILELKQEILAFVANGKLGKVSAQRLRGRMQFAEGQLYGRTGRRCIRSISEHATGNRIVITDKVKCFLRNFVAMLECDRPRIVDAKKSPPTIVLTDACYEADSVEWKCGLGGVVVGHSDNVMQFFSLCLSHEQRIQIGEGNKKQLIFEAETLAAVVAFALWDDLLLNCYSYLLVDNEGTKFSLIKGASDNDVVDALAEIFCEFESQFLGYNWLGRVSSFSNIADEPSRGACQPLLDKGFVDRSLDAQITLANVLAAVQRKLGEKAAPSNMSQLGKRVPRERRMNK